MTRDYYQVLGVDRGADQGAIKKAFRKMAKKYHPDANPDDPSAEARFKELNEAYEVLGDEKKRAQYDRFGADWQHYQGAGPGPGGGFGQQAHVNVEDLGSIFDTFFGGMNTGGGFGDFAGRGRSRVMRVDGQNIEQPITISLREAYEGAARLITKSGRQIRVNIPAGASDGTKVRLTGEGEPGQNGGRDGDLMLVVNVASDQQFRREGDDLHVDVEIDVFTAMLGGEVEIPTMTRPVRLKVPSGTQSGRRFRLTGKGMPVMRKKGQHGDLYAHAMLTVPAQLSDEQRQLVEQLRAAING